MSIEKEWAKSIHWMTSIVLDNTVLIERDELRDKLLKKGIDTRPIFPPMSGFPMFKKANNPIAEFVGRRGINLPCALNLSKEGVDFVSENVVALLEDTQNY